MSSGERDVRPCLTLCVYWSSAPLKSRSEPESESDEGEQLEEHPREVPENPGSLSLLLL